MILESESNTSVRFNIITICKDNLDGLKRTLSSIKLQNYKNIQIIIIDGGSSDGTTEFLSSLDFNCIWISEIDNGIYDAMNKGFRYCESGLTIWLNSGDIFLDERNLEQIACSFNQDKWHWAFGSIKYFDYSQNKDVSEHLQIPFNFQLLRFGIRWVPHQAAVFSQEVIELLKSYSTDIGSGADQEFMIRAASLFEPYYLDFFKIQMEIGGQSRIISKSARSKMWRKIRMKNNLLLLDNYHLDQLFYPILKVFDFSHTWYMRIKKRSKYFLR